MMKTIAYVSSTTKTTASTNTTAASPRITVINNYNERDCGQHC
jgi:hypothetical protein